MLEFCRFDNLHKLSIHRYDSIKDIVYFNEEDIPRKFSWNIDFDDIEDEREDMKLCNIISRGVVPFRYSKRYNTSISLYRRILFNLRFSKIYKPDKDKIYSVGMDQLLEVIK